MFFEPQRAACFAGFIANPSGKRVFSMVPHFMFIIFCFLFLCFLKFVFFLKHCKCVRCILCYLEFFFSNYTILLKRSNFVYVAKGNQLYQQLRWSSANKKLVSSFRVFISWQQPLFLYQIRLYRLLCMRKRSTRPIVFNI